MPTEAPAAPPAEAPAPPAAPPPATPPPAPPAAPPPRKEYPEGDFRKGNDFFDSIVQGLTLAVGEPPPEPKRDSPSTGKTLGQIMEEVEAKKAAAPPPAPETPPPAPAAEVPTGKVEVPTGKPEVPSGKIEVEKRPSIDALVEKTVKKTLESVQVPPAAAPAPAPAPAADPFEESLTEPERDELSFARWVSARYPEHKEYAGRVLTYFKKAADQIAALQKEDPDRTLDEDDEAFTKWKRQNAPALSQNERKKLERALIEESAVAKVKADYEARFQEVEQEARRAMVLPRIERETADHLKTIETDLTKNKESLAAPIVQRAAEVGWDTVLKEDGFLAPIVRSHEEASARYAQEFRFLSEGAKRFDRNDPAHTWLYGFVKGNSDYVANHEQLRVRDGRTFLPRDAYNEAVKKNPGVMHQHWTFSDSEMLTLIARNTSVNIESALKTEHERLERSGYRRQKPTETVTKKEDEKKETLVASGQRNGQAAAPGTPPAQTPPAPAPSPRATVSAAPGASPGGAGGNPPVNPDAAMVLKSLGIPR